MSVLRILRGEGAGGMSLRGDWLGGSYSWGWESEMVSGSSSWEGLGSLGVGVVVRAVSLAGSRMGFRSGLGGSGPIGRSGGTGLSGRWKSWALWLTRVGRLVSGENVESHWNFILKEFKNLVQWELLSSGDSFITWWGGHCARFDKCGRWHGFVKYRP